MATIQRAALNRYRQSLDKISKGAGTAASRTVERWLSNHPNATIEDIREAATSITDAVLGEYGDAASSLACNLFDSVMELEGVGVPGASVYAGARTGAVEGTIRRVVGVVDGTPESLAAFVGAIGTLATNEAFRAAGMTIESNVENVSKTRAGRNVRYARIPSGLNPCEWCAMLASRGFIYRSAESAEAGRHRDCTCTVVPGIRGVTKVDGYEPNYYKGVWKAGK